MGKKFVYDANVASLSLVLIVRPMGSKVFRFITCLYSKLRVRVTLRETLTARGMATLTLVLTFALLTLNSAMEVFEAEVDVPAVITTWNFRNATRKAWEVIFEEKRSAVDGVEAGCSVCEDEQCNFTVGYGGSPDENGETTLDAMIMDGTRMNVGAVGGLRRIKNAVGVARKVLENTKHSLLVGELATQFAVGMGFREESLQTDYSRELYRKWRDNGCQPNFRTRVLPDPSKHCGPYRPVSQSPPTCPRDARVGEDNHDTIGMVAVDSLGHVASGTSTNGARHKIPGRVGDSPIPGAGSYADDEVGGAAATGDGDVMMRFLPSLLAVEAMRGGQSPQKAARAAIERIRGRHPEFQGAVVALRKDGAFGAACSGMPTFPYCVATRGTGEVKVFHVTCK